MKSLTLFIRLYGFAGFNLCLCGSSALAAESIINPDFQVQAPTDRATTVSYDSRPQDELGGNSAAVKPAKDDLDDAAETAPALPLELQNPPRSTLDKPRKNKLIDSVKKTAWVPVGFESLNEPQFTEIDIWYGGSYLTSALARFTFEGFTLVEPGNVVDAISGLLNPDAMRVMLTRTFDTNSQLLCRSDFQVDCGYLEPTDVGVIFDRKNFKVSVFINANLLETTRAQESRFLPDSSATLSAYSNSSLFFSGSKGAAPTFNLNNNSMISLAENRLRLSSNWTDESGLVFDSLGLQRSYQGKELQLGLVRGNTSNLAFMDSSQFLGFSLESSVLTRTDLDQSVGTEIVLFFPTRSQVEIFRDDRLLHSGFYDIGNRTLETSSLPSGSYDVEIRITNVTGEIKIEERFFSKNNRLGPNDQILYFLQAGEEVIGSSDSLMPDSEGKILRAGFSKRLNQSTSFSFGLSQNRLSRLAEASVFRVGKYFDLSAGLAYEDNDAFGLNANLRVRFENFLLSLNSRKVVGGISEYQLQESQIQTNLNVGYKFPWGSLSMFYRGNEREAPGVSVPLGDFFYGDIAAEPDDFNNSNYGLRISNGGIEFGGGRIKINAEISQNNDDSLFLMNVNYTFRGRQSEYSISPRYIREDAAGERSSSRIQGTSSAGWRMGLENQHRVSVRADKQESDIVQARYERTGTTNMADVSVRHNSQGGRLDYTGRISASIASASGARAIGSGKNGAESAFLITVNGPVSDKTKYQVLVNGSPKGNAEAGRTLLVPVTPFVTYEVKLLPLGESLVNIERNNFVRTVYPGNVIALDWKANLVKVAYGRIVGAEGKPVVNAVISGAENGFNMTDDYGYFQLEMDGAVTELRVENIEGECRVEIISPLTDSEIVPLGTLQCI
mgnify:CR=1 FL=1